MERFNKFVSLAWYDGFIEFLFRFVAKTSEPLLAAGLVISAADFLTKGILMRDNPSLTIAWAWTQALAIESSSGVVFVYALQSFKARDKVKGIAYVVLAVLLATTGGAMLLIQLLANTNGANESALPVQFIVLMAILRVTVSIAYVFLCRAKHIRFSGPDDESNAAPGETSTSISEETVQVILSKLAKLDLLEQALTQPFTITQETGGTPLALAESVGETPFKLGMIERSMYDAMMDNPSDAHELLTLSESISLDEFTGVLKQRYNQYASYITPQRVSTVLAYARSQKVLETSETEEEQTDLTAQIEKLLNISPDITSREAAAIVGKPHSTVYRHMARVKQSLQS